MFGDNRSYAFFVRSFGCALFIYGGIKMYQQKVQLFLMNNQKKFDAAQLPTIIEKLEAIDDNQFLTVTGVNYKDPTVMLLISIFFGELGVDRFLLGDTTNGIIKLLTLGGLGIWAIIDWFSIQQKTKQKNFDMLMEALEIQNTLFGASSSMSSSKSENDAIEQIKKYKELLDAGVITTDEFEEKKKELLNK